MNSQVRASARDTARAATDEQRLTHKERVAIGKEARRLTPLESHAEFVPGQSRDPVGLLLEQDKSRMPELVPVRHGRMLVSPFAYYRGAALPMAADLAGTPTTELRAQLCGDAHLSNFGAFASPERRLVFDVSDFDETLPGPFEWDVKRLAASLAIAGRDNGFTAKARRRIVVAGAEAYRAAMRDFAERHFIDVWYATSSTTRSRTSPKPTPTRTSVITPRSVPPSRTAGSRRRPPNKVQPRGRPCRR